VIDSFCALCVCLCGDMSVCKRTSNMSVTVNVINCKLYRITGKCKKSGLMLTCQFYWPRLCFLFRFLCH
jgi:hypothetical protein